MLKVSHSSVGLRGDLGLTDIFILVQLSVAVTLLDCYSGSNLLELKLVYQLPRLLEEAEVVY